MRKWLIALAVVAPAAHPALAGDPVAGEVLAQVWCSSCHNVGPEDVASDAAPTFYTVMNVNERSADYLVGWLSDPHGGMPDPHLSRTEIDDIVSYMETLKTP